MSKLKLSGIKKIYEGGVEAVHDFNLDIADKEFIVLVGPSGCGKSTTLRMIAGLEDISAGELYIDDELVNDKEPKDRDIAMVFQSYALYPHMTVRENMAFALKIRHTPPDVIKKRVEWAAEILDITQYLDRKPKALSGGQRQRVAIGRAIVREPRVFLMDEPLSNLDAKLRHQMRAELIKLRQQVNTTFIYVTHDQTEALTLGDRIVIMQDGWIMQVGTPQEVFEHPANTFVAGFIGMPQINFFDAELERDKDDYSLMLDEAYILLPDRISKALAEKDVQPQKIILGCRPEHMSISNEVSPDTFAAKVDVNEMMGSEVHMHLTFKDQHVIVRIPTTELPSEHHQGYPVGTVLHLGFQKEMLHMFNIETKENLI
ncbi:MAG: sn-glycerol-3-phosphate ABC transporter ATP-binding protein UgpC [Clostridia bacterium]|nr:sn-glycerol-3-phosphate ABC transporter ATP-binding protein UgpC [Clostridia bacterium]